MRYKYLLLESLCALWWQSTFAHPVSSSHQAGELGAIASESSVCSKIGISVLGEGGNAADALVATQFCVGVIGM